jgi:hypothetical protein
MKQRKNLWRLWAKSLGEKASKCDRESDTIAFIRSFIFITYLITNCFIIYGVVRTHIFPKTQNPIKCIVINKYEYAKKVL